MPVQFDAEMKLLYYALLIVVATLILSAVLYLLIAPKKYEVYVSPFSGGPGLRGVQLTVKTPSLSAGPCGFSRYSSEIYTVRYRPAGVEQDFVDAQIERAGDPPTGPASGKVKITAVQTDGDNARVLHVEVSLSVGEANSLSHDYTVVNETPVHAHGWSKVAE